MVDIYSYADFREYLKEVLAQKTKSSKFSHRNFAKKAGLGSFSYLRMVIKGERNLSSQSIIQFAKGLGLNKKETAYFEALVLYNQARSREERDHHFEQLLNLKPRVKTKGLALDAYEYVSKILYVVLREMAALPEFHEDPYWISQALRYLIKPTEVPGAIALLERLKLLKRTKEGKLKHSGTTLETMPQTSSVEVVKFHREILAETRSMALTSDREARDITSITLPIAQKDLPAIKEILKKCREEIVQRVNQGSRDYHEVFHINMQLFPITRTKKLKK